MPRKMKDAFSKEIAKHEAQLNLGYAALLIAQYLTKAADEPTPYLTGLDEMAEAIRPSVLAAKTDVGTIKTLNHYLFEDLKFTGNDKNYYHPHNSFLNKVLELKRGIPISLSIVYLEIGWRLGLPLWGIGLPGHFIVGYGLPATPIYIDVFNQGQILTEEGCLELCQTKFDSYQSLRKKFLKPLTKSSILFRMLSNLKHIYLTQENWEAAYNTVDLMLIIRPYQISELRDRGLLAYRLDRLQQAIFDLQRYIFLAPHKPGTELLEKYVTVLETKLSQLN